MLIEFLIMGGPLAGYVIEEEELTDSITLPKEVVSELDETLTDAITFPVRRHVENGKCYALLVGGAFGPCDVSDAISDCQLKAIPPACLEKEA